MSLSLGQAAKIAGVTPAAIWQAIKAHKIIATKTKGKWEIDKASVEAYKSNIEAKAEARDQAKQKLNQSDVGVSSSEYLVEIERLKAKLEAAEWKNGQLAEQINDLKAERSNWFGMAQGAMNALHAAQTQISYHPLAETQETAVEAEFSETGPMKRAEDALSDVVVEKVATEQETSPKTEKRSFWARLGVG